MMTPSVSFVNVGQSDTVQCPHVECGVICELPYNGDKVFTTKYYCIINIYRIGGNFRGMKISLKA